MTATLTNQSKNVQTAASGGTYYGFGAFTISFAATGQLTNAGKTAATITNQSKN